ncbi:ATP-binding protein [Arthrobacter koreensis]|uniref:ATP-binding protein n=1 Tax=Arthrobacter koreensis TaxID=199136 RepID=UPI002DB9AC1C|nr:DUF87 domain-containing protein [Arthrobacter koreensis]MEB7504272.1 DUF87 domain-containing protein [Arthrobacter koreensis]
MVRISQAILAVGVLLLCGFVAGINPLTEWWFWTATTTVITAAIAEPYYTGPVAALLYGVGGLGAAIAASKQGVEFLWALYIVFAGLVIVSAVITLVAPEGRLSQVAQWFATRFGRPAWLGLAAVSIELLRAASERTLSTTGLVASGVLIATALSVPDWYRLFVALRPALGGFFLVEAAIEPNLLLVAGRTRLNAGQLVQVRGQRQVDGVVVGNLAHKSGNRIQIALTSSPWNEVASTSGEPVEMQVVESQEGPVLGLAIEGSTDVLLDVRSFGSLRRGDTVYWVDPKTSVRYLYQVLGLDLRRSDWDSAAAIAGNARAGLLGALDTTGIVVDQQLPSPFVPIFSAAGLDAALPEGYNRIGVVAGTRIPIGVSASSLRGHHLGILGMSGMGKSTIARRILETLSVGGVSVAMDATGEYASRYGLAPWDSANGLVTDGESVFEPQPGQGAHNSLAGQAQSFIDAAMVAATGEYAAGIPRPRSILIEEAHSFLPEWNFAIRGESDYVAQSCRMILQARKYGVNFVLVSQRTAVISKSAISQCESYIILRTLDDTSLQYVESVVGAEYRDVAAGLKRYQAICVGPAFSTASPVVVDLDPMETKPFSVNPARDEAPPF